MEGVINFNNVIITGSGGDIGGMMFSMLHEAGLAVHAYSGDLRADSAIVLHMAAKSPPCSCDQMIDSNILYLKEVVSYARNNEVKGLIFFSAASVYGGIDKEDVDETCRAYMPSFYGLTKLMGEQYLKSAGINALCLRLPAILGLRNTTNLLSRLYLKLRNNEAIVITNPDRAFNNFVSTANIAHLIINAKLKTDHDIVNLASTGDLTLMEIVMLMRELTSSSSEITISKDKAAFFNISTKKAEREYGFVPYKAQDAITQWIKERMQYDAHRRTI
ncbi:MAG: SDR family oxidoreductase [Candidatus Magnetominusculus sp. LBB02]|nr:SDR family oxidoreductase [Candidatus Magnetominusculus sp. LBB02]